MNPALYTLAIPALILAGPFVLLFAYRSLILASKVNKIMLDFSKLQSEVSTLETTVADLQAQAAASGDVANQATIDGIVSSLTTVNTNLSAMLPPPPPAPVVEPAPAA